MFRRIKRAFKKIGKAELFGILVDEQANCYCPNCIKSLQIEEIKNPTSKGTYYLYEILPNRDYSISEWQFKCIKCEERFKVSQLIKIRLVPFEEARDRSQVEGLIQRTLYPSQADKKRFKYGVLWG